MHDVKLNSRSATDDAVMQLPEGKMALCVCVCVSPKTKKMRVCVCVSGPGGARRVAGTCVGGDRLSRELMER